MIILRAAHRNNANCSKRLCTLLKNQPQSVQARKNTNQKLVQFDIKTAIYYLDYSLSWQIPIRSKSDKNVQT